MIQRPPKPEPFPCNLCGRPATVYWHTSGASKLLPGWTRSRMCHKGKNLRRNFGITCADFDKMLADQGGTCKFSWCDRPGEHIDHDHATGHVRGILCWQHNVHGMAFIDEVVRKDALAELLEYAGLDKLGGGQLVLNQ